MSHINLLTTLNCWHMLCSTITQLTNTYKPKNQKTHAWSLTILIIMKILEHIFTYSFFFLFLQTRVEANRAAIQMATLQADRRRLNTRTTVKNPNRSTAYGRPEMNYWWGVTSFS